MGSGRLCRASAAAQPGRAAGARVSTWVPVPLGRAGDPCILVDSRSYREALSAPYARLVVGSMSEPRRGGMVHTSIHPLLCTIAERIYPACCGCGARVRVSTPVSGSGIRFLFHCRLCAVLFVMYL